MVPFLILAVISCSSVVSVQSGPSCKLIPEPIYESPPTIFEAFTTDQSAILSMVCVPEYALVPDNSSRGLRFNHTYCVDGVFIDEPLSMDCVPPCETWSDTYLTEEAEEWVETVDLIGANVIPAIPGPEPKHHFSTHVEVTFKCKDGYSLEGLPKFLCYTRNLTRPYTGRYERLGKCVLDFNPGPDPGCTVQYIPERNKFVGHLLRNSPIHNLSRTIFQCFDGPGYCGRAAINALYITSAFDNSTGYPLESNYDAPRVGLHYYCHCRYTVGAGSSYDPNFVAEARARGDTIDMGVLNPGELPTEIAGPGFFEIHSDALNGRTGFATRVKIGDAISSDRLCQLAGGPIDFIHYVLIDDSCHRVVVNKTWTGPNPIDDLTGIRDFPGEGGHSYSGELTIGNPKGTRKKLLPLKTHHHQYPAKHLVPPVVTVYPTDNGMTVSITIDDPNPSGGTYVAGYNVTVTEVPDIVLITTCDNIIRIVSDTNSTMNDSVLNAIADANSTTVPQLSNLTVPVGNATGSINTTVNSTVSGNSTEMVTERNCTADNVTRQEIGGGKLYERNWYLINLGCSSLTYIKTLESMDIPFNKSFFISVVADYGYGLSEATEIYANSSEMPTVTTAAPNRLDSSITTGSVGQSVTGGQVGGDSSSAAGNSCSSVVCVLGSFIVLISSIGW